MKTINFIINIAFRFPSLTSLDSSVETKNLTTKLENLHNYTGPLASVFTPFTDDAEQNLNLAVIPKYAEFLASKNVSGVLVGGSMGEGTSLTVEERKQLAEAWADAVKKTKQHLMINVGGIALKSVKDLAAHAESIGADSLLVLPDLYVKVNSHEDMIEYLRLIGEAAPNTPLVYYLNKEDHGLNIDMARLFEAVGEKVPTFGGIKHVSSYGLLEPWNVGYDYKVFIGSDEAGLLGCMIGKNAMIMSTSTLAPELSFQILENCRNMTSPNYKLAVKAQDSINRIVKEIDSYAHDTVAMKAATSMVSKIPLGSVRRPHRPLSSEDLKSMAKSLTKLGFQV